MGNLPGLAHTYSNQASIGVCNKLSNDTNDKRRGRPCGTGHVPHRDAGAAAGSGSKQGRLSGVGACHFAMAIGLESLQFLVQQKRQSNSVIAPKSVSRLESRFTIIFQDPNGTGNPTNLGVAKLDRKSRLGNQEWRGAGMLCWCTGVL